MCVYIYIYIERDIYIYIEREICIQRSSRNSAAVAGSGRRRGCESDRSFKATALIRETEALRV